MAVMFFVLTEGGQQKPGTKVSSHCEICFHTDHFVSVVTAAEMLNSLCDQMKIWLLQKEPDCFSDSYQR